jgi:hypothetical protein
MEHHTHHVFQKITDIFILYHIILLSLWSNIIKLFIFPFVKSIDNNNKKMSSPLVVLKKGIGINLFML